MAKPNAFSEMLSLKGRIGRGEWWLIGFGLSILSGVVSFALATVLIGAENFGPTLSEHPTFHQIQLAMSAILFWPILAASVKRAHDRNGPGFLPFVYLLVNLATLAAQVVQPSLFEVSTNGDITQQDLMIGAFGLVSLVIALWLLITLGFLPGNKGTNRYGPSPKGDARGDYQAPRND